MKLLLATPENINYCQVTNVTIIPRMGEFVRVSHTDGNRLMKVVSVIFDYQKGIVAVSLEY